MLLTLQHCKEFCEKYYFSQDLNLVIILWLYLWLLLFIFFFIFIKSFDQKDATRRFIIDCRATVIRCRIDAVGAIDYLSTSAVAIVTWSCTPGTGDIAARNVKPPSPGGNRESNLQSTINH